MLEILKKIVSSNVKLYDCGLETDSHLAVLALAGILQRDKSERLLVVTKSTLHTDFVIWQRIF